jgi:hypothetical protein
MMNSVLLLCHILERELAIYVMVIHSLPIYHLCFRLKNTLFVSTRTHAAHGVLVSEALKGCVHRAPCSIRHTTPRSYAVLTVRIRHTTCRRYAVLTILFLHHTPYNVSTIRRMQPRMKTPQNPPFKTGVPKRPKRLR